jgi:thymidylate synthase (FAD)
MKIIKPYIEVVVPNVLAARNKIEWAGRKCYKSEDKITPESSTNFIRRIIRSGHESVIEHSVITVNFVVDRGVSHEIVRHRIAAYSQESTRYCTYGSAKFGQAITVVEPFFYLGDTDKWTHWHTSCLEAEKRYLALCASGSKPQEARSVLPNSLKTEVVTTYNLREWRHFFKLRASGASHPQMRQVAIPLLHYFQHILPGFFSDIDNWDKDFPVSHYAPIIEIYF